MEELAKVADKIAEEAKVAAVVAEVKPPEVEVPKVEVAVETPKVEETPVVATVEVPKVEEVPVVATVEIPKVEETKPIEAKVEETKPVVEAKIEEVKPVETKVEEVATAVPVLPQDAPMTNGVEEDEDSISFDDLIKLVELVPEIKEYDLEDFILGYCEEQEHLETVDGDEVKIAKIVIDHLKEDEEYYEEEEASTEVGLPTTVAIPTEPTQYTKADMEAKDTCIAALNAKLAEADVIVGKYNEYLKAEMAKKEKEAEEARKIEVMKRRTTLGKHAESLTDEDILDEGKYNDKMKDKTIAELAEAKENLEKELRKLKNIPEPEKAQIVPEVTPSFEVGTAHTAEADDPFVTQRKVDAIMAKNRQKSNK